MTWFLVAIIGPILYSITNHIDKMLLDKHFKHSGVGTLILVSALLSVVAVPIFYLIDPGVLSIGLSATLTLILVGALNIAVLWCYLMALEQDEASIVVVFYQLVPIIGLVLGYFILGETITQLQFIAMLIIIFGTTIISFDIDEENNFKLKKRTIGLMLAASTFWALESVVFKYTALEVNLWRALFWEHLVLFVIGLIIYIFVKSYRDNFNLALKGNSKPILGLNFTNEVTYMFGNGASSFAYLLAPIALILLMQSFQPIFVFAIGIFLTIFFPKINTEKIYYKSIWQKLLAIGITGIGTYLLLM